MRKRIRTCLISLIVILVLVIAVFSIHRANQSDAEKYYREYLACFKEDPRTAILDYQHFENQQVFQHALQSTYNVIYTYKDISVEQLSPNLWVCTAFITNYIRPEGYWVTNFVGILDGSYKVMASVNQIPPELKEGIDLSPYIDPDAITFDDLLG